MAQKVSDLEHRLACLNVEDCKDQQKKMKQYAEHSLSSLILLASSHPIEHVSIKDLHKALAKVETEKHCNFLSGNIADRNTLQPLL